MRRLQYGSIIHSIGNNGREKSRNDSKFIQIVSRKGGGSIGVSLSKHNQEATCRFDVAYNGRDPFYRCR